MVRACYASVLLRANRRAHEPRVGILGSGLRSDERSTLMTLLIDCMDTVHAE